MTDTIDWIGTTGSTFMGVRDAIHFAVVGVSAGENLLPGASIRVVSGVARSCGFVERHGIVDPFLMRSVLKDDVFWCFLNPKSITDLKHVWKHPDFPEETTDDDEADSICGC